MDGFELVDLSVYTEELGRLRVVPSGGTGTAPLLLPEGAVINIGITFRLGREVDGLTFEETRTLDGTELPTVRTVLGGFRTGGPYEVRLPPERLPVGRAHCGLYEVTCRFTDGDGRELAALRHRMRLVHQPTVTAT
ncbi:hypothetical protein ACWGI1_17225 [Streptomyces sp. NPDC054835]